MLYAPQENEMKIESDAIKKDSPPEALALQLPFGLIGLRHLTCFELEPAEPGIAFQILRAQSEPPMEFVVMEPGGWVEDYKIVLRDEDVESLRITSPEDVLVLNIVAVHSHEPHYVTVNLVGPVIVNRSTLIGQQVIIANSGDFSIEHVLVDQRPGAAIPEESPLPESTSPDSASHGGAQLP